MDSPKSNSDSSTEELYEAAIFNTNTLLPLLFENGQGLSDPEPQPKRGGSIEGKRGNIDRNRVMYHHLLLLFRAPNESSSRYFSLIFLRDFYTCPGTGKDTFSPPLLLLFLSLSIYIPGSFPSLPIIIGLLYCPLKCGGRLSSLLPGISAWRT